MYVIEVSNDTGTAEKRCKTIEKARAIARIAAMADYIGISNPELNPEQKLFRVDTVRLYDTKNPDVSLEY